MDGHIYRWDGAAWSDVGSGQTVWSETPSERFVFNGHEFHLAPGTLGVVTDPESGIDVAALTAAYSTVNTVTDGLSVSEDGQFLYVLAGDFTVRRFDQTGAHTTILTLETAATSLAVDTAHGLLWYGTIDSRVCAVTLP